MRLANQGEDDPELKELFEKTRSRNQTQLATSDRNANVSDQDDEDFGVQAKPSRATKTTAAKKKTTTQYSDEEDLEQEEVIASRPARGRGSRGGRGTFIDI